MKGKGSEEEPLSSRGLESGAHCLEGEIEADNQPTR